MTAKYPGGFLTDTAPVQFPALGGATNGIWNLNQAAYAAQTQSWAMYDPYWKNVTLMLNGDGTNGAQNNTFLDSSTNNFTITRNGNTTQGSFSPYGNLWSNYFSTAGSAYLNFSDPSNVCDLGNASASFEAWVYLTASTSVIINKSGGVADYNTTNGIEYTIASVSGVFTMYYNTGGTYGTLASGSASSLNTWHHVVVASNSTTLSMYVDGTRVATATAGITKPTTRTTVRIANDLGGTGLVGYISNLRIISGSNAYDPSASTIAVPTTPLTAVSGTSLLTCQSNRFIDNSSNNFTLTVNGTPSVQRFSPFNPTAPYSAATIGGSGYFDGTGDYLSVPSSAALGFGTGDFTMEAWVYFTSSDTSEFGLFGIDYPAGVIFEIYQRKLYLGCRGTAYDIGASVEVPQNAWTHLAITRSSNTVTLWQNGVSVGTGTITRNYPTGTGYIGVYAPSGPAFPGYISNLRIIKGTAVYTSAFTPPTSPVTAITNTQLLTNFTNAGIADAAMMNDLETVGNTQVSTSVKKYGTGSLAFNGSAGTRLYGSKNPNLGFGSGDFTIEMWVNQTAKASAYPRLLNFNATWNSAGAIAVTADNNDAPGKFSFGVYNIAAGILTSTTSIVAGTWYHLAITRSGSTFRMFVNGNLESTSTSAVAVDSGASYVTVGDAPTTESGEAFNGYIDDLRITKGYARYTTNFTPPTSALQNF